MLYFVILAVVQGLTEFLPISSSGHTELFKHLDFLQNPDQTLSGNFVNLVLHAGTLLAVILYYRKDLFEMVRALPGLLKPALMMQKRPDSVLYVPEGHSSAEDPDDHRARGLWLIVLLAVSTLMLFPVLAVKDDLDALLRGAPHLPVSFGALGLIFSANGLMLISSYLIFRKSRNSKGVDIKSAIGTGLSQMVAILPGLSRSGVTITTALWMGVERQAAVKFSLLLSIPTIAGGVVLEARHVDWSQAAHLALPVSLGILVSFVVGFLSIRFLERLVEKAMLYHFGVYCLGLGLFCLARSL